MITFSIIRCIYLQSMKIAFHVSYVKITIYYLHIQLNYCIFAK